MNDDQAVDLLQAMLRIPSVSGQEGALAAFLVERMREWGFDAHVDGAGNAVGTVGTVGVAGSGPVEVMLLGHMDTVPGDIPVRVEGGRVYGRGAVDAKGPLAAFIAAAARLALAGDLPLRLTVIGCVEEEVPSSRGAHYVLPLYRPDFCIVGEPSGWDGITLGYKGTLRATLRIEQGSRHSAHAGATVAERACEVWARIAGACEEFNSGRDSNFDRLLAALVGIRSASDGRTDRAELDVNLRLPPGTSPEEAGDWLARLAPESAVTLHSGVAAWAGSRATPLHNALVRAIRSTGGTPRSLLKTGTADLNLVAPAWGCPSLAYGPGDASLDHTPNEHIMLDEYIRGIAVLCHALGWLGHARTGTAGALGRAGCYLQTGVGR
jgi:[amino group carrier protein]-lysine/ornithine hydrolase